MRIIPTPSMATKAIMLPSIFLAALFLVLVEVEAALVPEAEDEDVDEDVAFEPVVAPDGVLLSSSARGVIARLEITFPPTSVTVWVTLVLETETILPLLALAIPLSIRSWAPDGTAGMDQLLAKVELVMSEDAQVGAVVVVFCALTPWIDVTLRVLN